MLNHNVNYPKMPREEVDKRIAEGMIHLKFVSKIYRYQMLHNRYFLHEHPRNAKSWRTAPIQHVLKHPSVLATHCHQCRYGAKTPGRDGEPCLILKPTRFMSNSVPMLRRLSKLCRGDHAHQPLEGKHRTEAAAIYPLPLLKAILQGMADTTHTDSVVKDMVEDEYCASLSLSMATVENPSFQSDKSLEPSINESTDPTAQSDLTRKDDEPVTHKPGTIPVQGGGYVKIHYALRDFKETYLDEYTREALPHELVRGAIKDEFELL